MRKWIYYCGSWASLIGCLLAASGLESYTGWAMAGCFVGALVLLALAVVLAGLGFANVRTETVRSDRPKGEVVYQSVQKDTVLKLEDEIVLRLSDESGTQPTETQPPTETTEETEKTLTVRFTVPNKEEPYLLTILQDGAVIVEDEKIPAGCTDYSLTLTGSGTKEYDLYINGEKYVTQRVNFDG